VGLLSVGTSIRMVAGVWGLVVAGTTSVLLRRGRAAWEIVEGGGDLVLGIEVFVWAGDACAGPLRG
jgi:hypothetical protein